MRRKRRDEPTPEEMLRAVEEQSEPTRAILMGVERASECSSWLPLVSNPMKPSSNCRGCLAWTRSEHEPSWTCSFFG